MLHDELFVAADGLCTVDETKGTGLPSRHALEHPDDVLVVDETGNNTNQKGDGPIGGEKSVVPTDGTCNGLNGSTADHHFTTLVFQTATGKPVLCCAIMKSDDCPANMKLNWKTGVDVLAAGEDGIVEDSKNVSDAEVPRAAGRPCGGGPVCSFRGKRIPPIVACTKNASVTSETLVECLRHLDSCCLFTRGNGRMPFLSLDGHCSRFGLPFLQYIHGEGHKWKVCIGVPCATHWWQVADASQVNGAYKMAATRAKRAMFRAKRGKPLEKTDIIPTVNHSWEASFGNVAQARKAILERGWNPLNYALMTNQKLMSQFKSREQAKKPPGTVEMSSATSAANSTSSATAFTLSGPTTTGFLDDIVRSQLKDEGKREQIRKKRQHEEATTATLSRIKALTGKPKKLTSGRLMNEGNLHLSEDLLEEVAAQCEKKEEDKRKKQQQTEQREIQKEEALKEAIGMHCRGDNLLKKHLKSLLEHVRRSSDAKKLPNTRPELLELWEERKCRLPSFTEV